MRPPDDRGLVRFYRRLLRLYPAAFREEFESEMTAMVADAHAGRGRGGSLTAGAALVADVLASAPREHMTMLKEDIRQALRAARKAPAITACILLVFAVGIGATTAVFTLANAVLLRPLPFAEPERLVFLDESAPKRGIPSMGTTFPNLLDYQRQNRSFTGIGAYFGAGFTLTGGGDPERVDGAFVSWNLFQVLGVHPLIGRHFVREEDQPNAETAVMLGYGLWQRRYGGDPAIVGRPIQVGGRPRVVVGVMPAGFRFPETGELWAPMGLDVAKNTRTDNFLVAVARLAPGVSIARARADMDAIVAELGRKYPDSSSDLRLNVLPLHDTVAGQYEPVLVRLLAAGLFVLAIACTNVANLLLARAAARRREVALRTTLGAHPRRIVRQLLTESLVIGIAGGVLGLIVGVAVVPALLRSSPVELPYWIHLEPDWRVLLFSVAAMIAAGALSGLAPALHAARTDAARVLNDGGKGSSAGPRTTRLREALVAVQLAMSVVLLAGAGLMVRSFVNLAHVDLGFTPADALTFRLSLPETRYDERAIAPFYQRAVAELRAIPGVRAAGAGSSAPMRGQWWRALMAEGEHKSTLAELPSALNVAVTPGYFRAMGIPLEKGRDFTDRDDERAPVVIVNRTIAERYWPGENPIGRRLRIDSFLPDTPWRTVVGVAGDARWGNPRDPVPMTVYVPVTDTPQRSLTFVVRSAAALPTLTNDVRAIVKRLDPDLPLAAVRSLDALVSGATWNFRLYTQLFALFAGIALALAAIGLGGIMSHMVIERTHEIGIRLAVGATARDVVALVARRAALLVGAGVCAGIVGALLLTRSMSAILFGVTAQDAPTLAMALVLLAAVALVAGLLPARRAAKVNPLVALRAD